MKLAEALNIRADLQRRSHQLRERILRNAKIQVDEKPAEDPNELLNELEQVNTELVQLIKAINKLIAVFVSTSIKCSLIYYPKETIFLNR